MQLRPPINPRIIPQANYPVSPRMLSVPQPGGYLPYSPQPPQMVHGPNIPIQGRPITMPINSPPMQAMYRPGPQVQPHYTIPPQYAPGPIYGPPPGIGYTGYPFQPIPGRNNHAQFDINKNFDYEQANFLTDTKIVENTVYCVICGESFKGTQKQEHLKLHMRKPNSSIYSKKPQQDLSRASLYFKTSSLKNKYIVKPIIEPEEHYVDYQPLTYQVVEEIVYEDKPKIQKVDREAQAKDQKSFLDQNLNMSIDEPKERNIHKTLDIRPNPHLNNKGNAPQVRSQIQEINQPFLNSHMAKSVQQYYEPAPRKNDSHPLQLQQPYQHNYQEPVKGNEPTLNKPKEAPVQELRKGQNNRIFKDFYNYDPNKSSSLEIQEGQNNSFLSS